MGFMGAGKSTVGACLAERLGWAFADADLEVAREAGASIEAIFARAGEPAFRALERAWMERRFATEDVVLSPGAGAIDDPKNRRLIFTQATVVYLSATRETLARRLGPGAAGRPLLAGGFPDALFERRRPLYERAHHTIETDALDREAVANAISAWWRERETA